MKRPIYQISLEGIPVATKHAWNSALREMPRQIASALIAGTAREIGKEVTMLDRWRMSHGVFRWQTSYGETLNVEIRLLNAADFA